MMFTGEYLCATFFRIKEYPMVDKTAINIKAMPNGDALN